MGNAEEIQKNFPEHIYRKEDLDSLVYDAIVVTSVSHYMEICRELKNVRGAENILAYADLVFHAYKETDNLETERKDET